MTSFPMARLLGHPFSAEHAHIYFFQLNCPVSMLDLFKLVEQGMFPLVLFVIDLNLALFMITEEMSDLLSHSLWKFCL